MQEEHTTPTIWLENLEHYPTLDLDAAHRSKHVRAISAKNKKLAKSRNRNKLAIKSRRKNRR